MKIIITESQLRKLINGVINEDFKTQKNKFIQQGNDEGIVDKYLNDFREIKDKKYKELENADLDGLNIEKGMKRYDIDQYKTFKELELVVDYMAGQRNFGSANFEDIKVDGKPIFENEKVEIYYAPNRQSCVEYKGNKPYSWCVSRSDASNMYMRYRMGETEPSFYFVKRKGATDNEFNYWNTSGKKFEGDFRDKWHFFVIQVLKGGEYVVTSALNDGDKKMSWEQILGIAPELNGLQDYFKNVPLGDDEKGKYERFKDGLNDEEFSKLSYKDKEYYIDVYVTLINTLTDKQFQSLPSDLKNKYMNLGVSLTNNQVELIKQDGKLLNRYNKILDERLETFFKLRKNDPNQAIFSKFSSGDYELIKGENKNKFDYLLELDINRFILMLIKSNPRQYRFYYDLELLNEIGYNKIPEMFFVEKFIKKDIKNEFMEKSDLIDLFGIYYLKTNKNDFYKFLNFIGETEKGFIKNLGDMGKENYLSLRS
jgi:hypothetical protein